MKFVFMGLSINSGSRFELSNIHARAKRHSFDLGKVFRVLKVSLATIGSGGYGGFTSPCSDI